MEEKDTSESHVLNPSMIEETKQVSIEMQPEPEQQGPKSYQFRALLRKTVVLQLRQKASSIVQVACAFIVLNLIH